MWHVGYKRNAYIGVVLQPSGKTPLDRNKPEWEGVIKIDVKE